MRNVAIVLALLLAGCLKPSSFQCGDGRTCPADTVCDERNEMCLTPSQATVCKDEGIAVGKPCDADGTPGICNEDNYCEPGCGDGLTDRDEQCDDGNFASHDGCSSRCLVEVPSWTRVESPWSGVSQHVAAYHPGLERIVLLGGFGEDGIRDEIWQMDPTKADQIDGGWHDVTAAFPDGARPTPKVGSGIAYDEKRGVLVVFGGVSKTDVTDETWEYNVTSTTFEGDRVGQWTKVSTPVSPGKRYWHAMAYDPSIEKIVLYGGLQEAVEPNDTWTYDGTWTKLTTATTPDLGNRMSMAYDPGRGKLVMVGATPQVWELSNGDWTSLSPSPRPRGRRSTAMTYDPDRQKIVIFGGLTAGMVDADTWTWDGAWQQVTSTASPPGRRAGTLVHDPINHNLVLVGGGPVSDDVNYADVWVLSTTAWTERTPRFMPPPTLQSAAALSSKDHTLVVVGGYVSSPVTDGHESWSFDGVRWKRLADAPVARWGHGLVYDTPHDRFLFAGGYCGDTSDTDCTPGGTPVTHPPGAFALSGTSWTALTASWSNSRAHAAFVFDEVNHNTVVFGGNQDMTPTFTYPTDTWIFDGMSWALQATTQHPAPTQHPAAAWDPVLGAVILFDSAGVTWQYRDGDWTELVPYDAQATPPKREQSSMVYDVFRKRMVLMGGASGGELVGDVWELDTENRVWTRLYVPGASPLPRYDFVLGAIPEARALVLYGGAGGTSFPQSDVWTFQYRSDTPDEICGDGDDSDEDAQDDSEDPDCLPPPM